jgi:DNA-directed RNA polymerase subunit RPC12/RpoP
MTLKLIRIEGLRHFYECEKCKKEFQDSVLHHCAEGHICPHCGYINFWKNGSNKT